MLAWHETHVRGEYEAYSGGYRFVISPYPHRIGGDVEWRYKLEITGVRYHTVQRYRTIGPAKGQATRTAKRLQRLYGARVPSLTSADL